MRRRCQTCGTTFDGEWWQRRCWPCWREPRDGEERKAAYRRGYAEGFAAAAQPPLDGELVRRAVALTHPDRHPAERCAGRMQ
jgi:hypothetical protein